MDRRLATIVEYRQRLKKALKESLSLQPYFDEIFNECYQDIRELAAAETEIAIDVFPVEPPFCADQTLNSDYLPDEGDRIV